MKHLLTALAAACGLACVGSIALGCTTTTTSTNDPLRGGGGTAEVEAAAAAQKVGSARVWYRVYKNEKVAGIVHGARAKEQRTILLNESHSAYQGLASDNLGADEYMVADVTMYTLLKSLRDAGLFKADNGARAIQTPPDAYAEALSRKPQKWIAVEQDGYLTWLEQPDPASAPQSENDPRWRPFKKAWDTFFNCEMLFLDAAARAYGKGVVSNDRNSGMSREELEARRKQQMAENARKPPSEWRR